MSNKSNGSTTASDSITCVGGSKERIVLRHGDGSSEVLAWDLNGQTVPALSQVEVTLVRYSIAYYQHAHCSPEVMESRSENIARLGWSSESFDLPLPPETAGSFNLLSGAIRAAHRELTPSRTYAETGYPSMLKLSSDGRADPRFVVYLNLAAYEFYHLLFAASGRYSHLQFKVAPIDVDTCPKLLAWLRRFEQDKAEQYRVNGFEWRPRRKPKEVNNG
jgi:hypothetical protein